LPVLRAATGLRHWRIILAGALLSLLAGAGYPQAGDPISTVIALESNLGARIGLAVKDLQSGEHWEYRASERFPLSSTFKPLACAALLARVDQGLERLDRQVAVTAQDLVSYSPVTEARLEGMTLAELCEAAITLSDNTAGNLVLTAIGGPAGLTAFLRTLGDPVTRLDRWETDLNEGIPGDPRDTTTPAAIAGLMEQLVLGEEVLADGSRVQLTTWLRGNAVGDDLLRAGIPAEWDVGDKTGAGGFGSRSIVAVLWPPARRPIVVAAYITDTEASFEARNAAIAEIGRAIARWVSN
jgi:beta-lactamase class A